MKNVQFNQLLYEALETEIGGVQVYENAIQCAVNDDLKEEWQKYLGQTQKHEQIVRGLLEKFGLARRPFFLYVGASDWHKNIEGMLAGFAGARQSGTDAILVWAGKLDEEEKRSVLAMGCPHAGQLASAGRPLRL